MALEFNEKQQEAVSKINDFIAQNIYKIFYLLGYAGTGKTFLMARLLKDFLRNANIDRIIICAPTHQALKVIESYIKSSLSPREQKEFQSKINFMTLHKLLEFKPVVMNENGLKVFKPTRESKFLKQIENKIIIIDESSMIPKNMVVHLKKYTDLYPIKLIVLGDDAQLPPIGEPFSSIFNVGKKYKYHILLDQIMRTNSPDIKNVCGIIRNWDQDESLAKLLLPIHNKKGDFKLYHKKSKPKETTWFKNFIKKINSKEIPIILTWSNPQADYYNKIIRKYIHKSANLENYVKGDCAILNNYYSSPVDNSNFYTSDMISIISVSIEEKLLFDWSTLSNPNPKTLCDKELNIMVKKFSKHSSKMKIDNLLVNKVSTNSTFRNNQTYTVKTINRQDLDRYASMLKLVKEHIKSFFEKHKSDILTTKLWDIYHKFLIDPYAEIKFGFSITTHKAQGSTFGTVIVDVEDISSNPDIDEMQKALYTAAGRASNELSFLL